jgi:hypothetical protein
MPPFHSSSIHFKYCPPIYAWVFQVVTFSHVSSQIPICTPRLPAYVLHALTICFLNLITQMIFGEEYRAWSSSLCSLLHSSVTSSLSGPNILLSTLFLTRKLSANVRSSVWATKFHTHIKNFNIYIFGYINAVSGNKNKIFHIDAKESKGVEVSLY